MPSDEIIVLAHNIRSTYNIGSFFRTADAVGVCRIALSGYSARPPHKGISKTALGAEQNVDWEPVTRIGPWIQKKKQAGYTIAALEQGMGARSLFRWKPKFPLVLILGNELRGVHKSIQKSADIKLEIPMLGKKESLNVATAMGIAVFWLRYCD